MHPTTALQRDLPDDVLIATLTHELDEEYLDKALETGSKMFDEADAQFALGRVANENGDRFQLAGVYFTVALFFATVPWP